MGWLKGFEPSNNGATIRRVDHFTTATIWARKPATQYILACRHCYVKKKILENINYCYSCTYQIFVTAIVYTIWPHFAIVFLEYQKVSVFTDNNKKTFFHKGHKVHEGHPLRATVLLVSMLTFIYPEPLCVLCGSYFFRTFRNTASAVFLRIPWNRSVVV